MRWLRFVFFGAIIFFIWIFFDKLNEDELDLENGTVLFVFLVSFSILCFLLDRSKTVEYDSSYLYVIGKKATVQVPLSAVSEIKLTGIQVNNISLWYIEFRLESGKTDSVTYVPQWFQRNMSEFQSLVKRSNKNVQIRNWSF